MTSDYLTDGSQESEHDKVLSKANSKIKAAWVTGVFIGAITLLIWLISVFTAVPLGASIVIDAIIVFALTFGVYKKSRICAGLLAIFYIIGSSVIFRGLDFYNIFTVIINIVVLFFLIRGFINTIIYHRTVKKLEEEGDFSYAE